MAERVGFEPTVPFSTSVFKTGAFSRALPPLQTYLFLDLYVSNWLSQLLQTNLRFSNRLSLLTPLIWSRIIGIGLPFHSGPIPQHAQTYGINSCWRIRLFRACLAYVEFSTRTSSSGYFSSQILFLPTFLPLNGLGLPFRQPALGECLCVTRLGFSLHDISCALREPAFLISRSQNWQFIRNSFSVYCYYL